MPDHYCYADSFVLINKFGITDYDRWKAVETAAIHQRMVELIEHPIEGAFDLNHLRAIHRHLTQDLYVWGGELRDTDTRPIGTGIAHCRPEFISAEAERVFRSLAEQHHLQGLAVDKFADALAWVWGEATAIHPFRDVNTRSQHVMFNQLARAAGWTIDWSQIAGDVFAHARTLAIVQDHSGLEALIRPNLQRFSRSEIERSALATRESSGFTGPRRSREPHRLERDLDAARERRRQLGSAEPSSRSDPPDPYRGGPSIGL